VSAPEGGIPPDAKVSTHRHRVAFFETDAMGVVHHSNYIRFLETGRIHWMDRFHEPYRSYVQRDLHFAVTRVEVRYLLAAAFDDELEVSTWLDAIRGASLRMVYSVRRGEELVATAATEHAMVDGSGRLRRIPRELRERLAEQAASKEWRER
jgi:acyl-CoA thioester hydrolase